MAKRQGLGYFYHYDNPQKKRLGIHSKTKTSKVNIVNTIKEISRTRKMKLGDILSLKSMKFMDEPRKKDIKKINTIPNLLQDSLLSISKVTHHLRMIHQN